MIKNEKGITLVVLAITIIVMTILATVVTYSALDSLRTAQKNAFISEMEMVQAKVNVIYEKMQNNTQDIEYYNSLGQDISVLGDETLIKILGNSSRDGFKYFSKEDLKNLELEDINQEVIINFSTREVISTRGIKIGGVMYYKLSNIPNYKGHNIDYINKNTEAPTFEVEQTKLESGWKFTIKNIKYNSNVEGGTLSYKLHNDTNWIIAGQDTSFIATKPGIYDIKFTDKAGNSAEVQRQVYVEDGMLAYYDGENNTGNGHSDTTIVWKDLSGNGNDGLLRNFQNTSNSGWSSNGLIFDGEDDGLYLSDNFKELFNDDVTIEMVINFSGDNSRDVIMGNHPNTDNGVSLERGRNETDIQLRGRVWYNNGIVDQITTQDVYYLNKNMNINCTLNKANNQFSFGANGITKESIKNEIFKQNTDFSHAWIGRDERTGITSLTGTIHAVRIYDRVLTEDELKTNYEIDKFRFGITE